jgi:hypothetical protein
LGRRGFAPAFSCPERTVKPGKQLKKETQRGADLLKSRRRFLTFKC